MRAKPSVELMRAHEMARQVFHLPKDSYMPHLSLVYGTYSEHERQRVVSTLSPDLRLSFTARSFELIRSDSPDPADWHTVHALSFG